MASSTSSTEASRVVGRSPRLKESAATGVVERVGRLVHLGGKLLQAPRHANAPALIAEMALDLRLRSSASHTWWNSRPRSGIEAIDCLEQSEITDLHEVVERFAAVLELVCEESDEVHVRHDELLARVHIALLLIAAEELSRLLLVPGRFARRGLICHIRYPP